MVSRRRFLKMPLVSAFGLVSQADGQVDDQERHFIYVSSEKVQVDSATFEILMIGENLKVRFTRGNKAINIDRLIPTQGPV